MADYVPNTIVRVLKDVPLDDTYSDVIKFTSIGAQTSYFAGKAKYSFTDFTYQRVNSSVAQPRGPLSCRVPEVADNLYDCNYIMFQNSNYGQKWFYAFIKQVNYVNPNNTEIIYELDHYQTWLFDFTVHECFVEREHYISDSGSEPLFVSLQPEPVHIGEYREIDFQNYYMGADNVIVATTTDPSGQTVSGQVTNGMYSGCQYHDFPLSAGAINGLLSEYAAEGRLDAVVAIQQSPISSTTQQSENWTVSVPFTVMDGAYTPRNKKLLSYPYIYFSLQNCDGDSEILYPQVFGGAGQQLQQPNFLIYKIGGIPPAIVCVPTNYGDPGSLTGRNMSHAIAINEVPPCCWAGNAFANWIAQNSMSMGLKALGSVFEIGAGALTKNVGGIVSGVSGLIGQGVEIQKASMQNTPQLQGKPMSCNFNIAMGRFGFEFRTFSILRANAEVIDQFFDAFGYATNKLKVPNMEGREKWNFVKTNGAIISGSLPVEAMARIKQMFNDGVRFWHGELTRNLNQPNPIVPKEARAHVEQRSIQTPFNASL